MNRHQSSSVEEKNRINLYWYRHKEGHGNFGDELNPYIIKKMTGKEVHFVNIWYLGMTCFRFIVIVLVSYTFLRKKMAFIEYLRNLYRYFVRRPKVLIAIGSVLQSVKYENCVVWGAGIIEKKAIFSSVNFRAVRGTETQKRIAELGYDVPSVVGDPALILPLLYQPKEKKKYNVGVLPHYIHFRTLECLSSDHIKVINLLGSIEKIIDEINSCSFVLSTSLHGVIVSHTYGIPAIWRTDKENKLGGDDIKFKDYFSSVGIGRYSPIPIERVLKGSSAIEELIQGLSSEQRLPPKEVVESLQKGLIGAFPVGLCPSFKKTVASIWKDFFECNMSC